MNVKFWAINAIAFFIIISYTVSFFLHHGKGENPFWEASPFQLVFIIAFIYIVTEGKLVQKVILAKKVKDEGTLHEFGVINKSSDAMDKMLLDRIKKG
jgi:hypothetical protein